MWYKTQWWNYFQLHYLDIYFFGSIDTYLGEKFTPVLVALSPLIVFVGECIPFMTHYFLFSRQIHKRPCHWLRALMAPKAFFQMCWFWAPDIMGVFYLSLHEKYFLVIWSFIFLSSKENTYLSLKECVIWVCYQITTGEILNIYWMYAFRLNWLIYYREMVCILLLGVSTWCLKKLTETLTSIR